MQRLFANTPFYTHSFLKRKEAKSHSPADFVRRPPRVSNVHQGECRQICWPAKQETCHPSQSTPSARLSLPFSPRNLTGHPMTDVMTTHLQGTNDSTSGVAESNHVSPFHSGFGIRGDEAATVELSAKAKSEVVPGHVQVPRQPESHVMPDCRNSSSTLNSGTLNSSTEN